jgi:hypothetical protein
MQAGDFGRRPLRRLRDLQVWVAIGLAFIAVWAALLLGRFLSDRAIVVSIPARTVAGMTSPGGLPAGEVVAGDSTLQAQVAHPSTTQGLWYLLEWLPLVIAVGLLLTLLLRMVRAVGRGEMFAAETVSGLRRLGAVAMANGPVLFVTHAVSGFLLARTVTSLAQFSPDLGDWVPWWLAGFVFLIIAGLVDRGRSLQTELDQVI